MDNKCFEYAVMGQDVEVPLINGKYVKYVNLDMETSPRFRG